VLWFFRNPTDPSFDVIKEIVNTGVLRYIRRVMMSLILYAVIIVTVIQVPLMIAKAVRGGDCFARYTYHSTTSDSLIHSLFYTDDSICGIQQLTQSNNYVTRFDLWRPRFLRGARAKHLHSRQLACRHYRARSLVRPHVVSVATCR
jgi:E3 ubiquitin-protein ligase DOA10